MRAVFVKPEDPAQPVGSAVWTRDGARIEASGGEEIRAALARVFRETQVLVDDPSLRSFGTSGPVVLQPGSLRWFRAAAESRGAREGFGVRFVLDEKGSVGWDPAGGYVPFSAVGEGR